MNENITLNARAMIMALLKILGVWIGYHVLVYYYQQILNHPITYQHISITPHSLLLAIVFFWMTLQTTVFLRAILWDYYLPKHKNIHVSSLFVNVINFFVYIISLFIVFNSVFGMNIESAFAATGAIGVVLGFGLQKMFSDFFMGISMDMDKSFQIGNWVYFKYNGEEIVGFITQMTWRVLYIQSPENKTYIIPNNVFGNLLVTNLNLPSVDAEFEILYYIPFHFKEKQVLQVLMCAASALELTGKIFDIRCRISETTLQGIVYKIKYFIKPNVISRGKSRHLIHSYVFRFLRSEQITFADDSNMNFYMNNYGDSFPMPFVSDKVPPMGNQNTDSGPKNHPLTPLADKIYCLSQIDIFAILGEEKLAEIAHHSRCVSFQKGDEICTQGQDGQSLFIIKEGYAKVMIQIPPLPSLSTDGIADGATVFPEPQQVAVLIPEDYFGEMSLLTGEKRSATVVAESKMVVYEVPATALMPLLSDNDKFYTLLAQTIAEREWVNNKMKNQSRSSPHHISRIKELEEKIKNFAKKIWAYTALG